MVTLNVVVNLYEEQCINCGIVFHMPMGFHANRKRDKRAFHCPNGHAQHYTRTTEDELREQLAAKDGELRRVSIERDDYSMNVERLRRRLARKK